MTLPLQAKSAEICQEMAGFGRRGRHAQARAQIAKRDPIALRAGLAGVHCHVADARRRGQRDRRAGVQLGIEPGAFGMVTKGTHGVGDEISLLTGCEEEAESLCHGHSRPLNPIPEKG